jgi:hypothetical protein
MTSDLITRLWVDERCPYGLAGGEEKRRSAGRMICSKIPLCYIDCCVVSNGRIIVRDAFGN